MGRKEGDEKEGMKEKKEGRRKRKSENLSTEEETRAGATLCLGHSNVRSMQFGSPLAHQIQGLNR